jgi:hypothetical protein
MLTSAASGKRRLHPLRIVRRQIRGERRFNHQRLRHALAIGVIGELTGEIGREAKGMLRSHRCSQSCMPSPGSSAACRAIPRACWRSARARAASSSDSSSPKTNSGVGCRLCRRHGLVDTWVHAHGHDVRSHGRSTPRTVSRERPLHGLRHFVQCRINPGSRSRSVHRGGALERWRRKSVPGRNLSFRDGDSYAACAADRQGN